jgi:hypothetical protein
LPRRFAQPGIDMSEDDREAVGARDAVQDRRKGDGVRTAAAGDEDRLTRPKRDRGPHEAIE